MIASIEIILIFLVLSVAGEDEVCTTENGFSICETSTTVTGVTHNDVDSSSTHLSLKMPGDTAIGPKAFSHLTISALDINLRTDGLYNRSPNNSLFLLPDSFTELNVLTSLHIHNAKINYTGNPLAPLDSLLILKLNSCGLTDIPVDILKPLPSLAELSLGDNHLGIINSGVFQFMKNLKKLDLSRNDITRLEPGCFSELTMLEVLDLSMNSVNAEPGIFNGLNSLKKLILTNAFDINGFKPIILQNVPAVTELRLSFNKLKSLETSTFDSVPTLRELSLNGNFIRSIPKDVFGKLTSLKQVNLEQNIIESIEPCAFAGLNLTTLDLSLNDIRKINTDTFNGLIIETLLVRKNQIEELGPQAFNGLIANEINLGQNNLEKIGTQDLSGLKAETLDLSRNRIEDIAPGAFNNSEVKKLSLYINPINIDGRATWGLSNSVEVQV